MTGVPRVVSLLFDLSVCLCRPECLSVTGLRFYRGTSCPWREMVGAAVGGETTPDGTHARGIMIGGVPVGDDAYVMEV